MFELADRVAIATGGNGGIGFGIFRLNCSVGARTVNAQAYAGVDSCARSGRALDFFRLDINRLPDFVEDARLQAAVAGDMCRDLQFLPIGIALNTGV